MSAQNAFHANYRGVLIGEENVDLTVMEEIALLDLKLLLVHQATHVLAGRSSRGEMFAVTDITTLPSVVVAWKQESV